MNEQEKAHLEEVKKVFKEKVEQHSPCVLAPNECEILLKALQQLESVGG